MTSTSKEYAYALFSLASESGCIGEIEKGLSLIADVFEKTPDLTLYLKSPAIPKSARLETVQRAFSENVPEYACSFVSMLCEHGLIDLLPECIAEYRRLYQEDKNLRRAVVTSAVELTREEKEKLRVRLEKRSGRHYEFEYRIDPALIGGLVVEADGVIIDGSLKRRLATMEEVLKS